MNDRPLFCKTAKWKIGQPVWDITRAGKTIGNKFTIRCAARGCITNIEDNILTVHFPVSGSTGKFTMEGVEIGDNSNILYLYPTMILQIKEHKECSHCPFFHMINWNS